MKYWIFMLWASFAWGDRVLDLGKMESQGKFRGPEIQWTDSGQLDDQSRDSLIWSQLKKLEEELLNDPKDKKRRK